MADLWENVRRVASADPRLTVLDDAAAEAVVERVVETFIEDRDRNWWWTALRGKTGHVAYSNVSEGLDALAARVGGEPSVHLVVTDERPDPLGVLTGPADAVLDLLGETPIFEFALVDPSFRWLAFDRHDNVLLFAGDVPNG